MVRFLINRPIAVTMTFMAILIVGLVASALIPISLMPDVDIPKITVNIINEKMPSGELENTVVKPLRNSLMQVAHLSDIKTEAHGGSATIHLSFNYGTHIDFAFIEVNEKIDRAMSSLPESQERPSVIKASATDVPVFYLNLTLNGEASSKKSTTARKPNTADNVSHQFVQLSNFANQVISKRIEQLPEVALADISGQVFSELLIVPDFSKLDATGIRVDDIKSALNQNNLDLGNLLIHDGRYQYNVRVGNKLTTKDEIENVYIRTKDRILQLKDIATITERPQKRRGLIKSEGKDAISLAIIKQSDARMSDLKESLHTLIGQMENDYPEIGFSMTRDQTKLLDFSIRNLKQSLFFGAILAFVIMFFFLKDFKSPLLIGITIPTSLIISLFFLYLFHISLNIVSLSGLVLAVGMMIDNSIIVIDNIAQHRERGNSLSDACTNGAMEVFRPMLSSVLTTCAVFVPLVFVGGISGAVFYEQALSVTTGLFVSLLVSITLLPVYYKVLYGKTRGSKKESILARINHIDYVGAYEKGLAFTLRRQPIVLGILALLLFGGVFIFGGLKKEKMPTVTKNDVVLHIDWNEAVNIYESNNRLQELTINVNNFLLHHTAFVGEQQFLFEHDAPNSGAEALLYLEAISPNAIGSVKTELEQYLKQAYPKAIFSFENAENVFELLFSDNAPPLEARLRATRNFGPEKNQKLKHVVDKLQHDLPEYKIEPIGWSEQLLLSVDPALLLLYGVSYEQVEQALKISFSEDEVFLITENQNSIPVVLSKPSQSIEKTIDGLSVQKKDGQRIRLTSLLKQQREKGLKTIVAGQEGEYFPVSFKIPDSEVEKTMLKIRQSIQSDTEYEVNFTGNWFTNKELVRKMTFILGISLLLLYFILASQFESLTLPLIVLLEVPIDVAGVIFSLKLFGASLNLMSMIGIVVMTGIVINDSILKIDTMNKLIDQGHGVIRAIYIAGNRRLKPILMTSLTTILALVPFLFMKGMGADLQRPLAYSVIGGMLLGTLVSLYFVPLCYYYLKRNKV